MASWTTQTPLRYSFYTIDKSALSGHAPEDDEFYLGVLREGELWQLHYIMAGGPLRGTMALDTETAPTHLSRQCRAICSENQ